MENIREQSEFDMSFSYLFRLNGIILAVDDASLDLDYWRWFHSLMVLYREVSTELKGNVNIILGEEPINDKDEYLFVEKMISQIEPLISKYQQRGNNGINYELYKKLHVLDIFLRQILKKSGILLKMRQDPRFALANG